MPLRGLDNIVACGGLAAQVILLFVLLRFRRTSQYPALVCATGIDAAAGLVLGSCILRHWSYQVYGYTYWITAAVQSLVRLWLVVNVAQSFPGLGFLPRSIYAFGGMFALALAIGVGIFSFHADPALGQGLTCILLYSRAVSLAWLVFGLAGLVYTKIFNFGWDQLGARIACGVTVQIAAETVASQFAVLSRAVAAWSYSLESICCIGVLLYWSYWFSRNIPPAPERAVLPETMHLLLTLVRRES